MKTTTLNTLTRTLFTGILATVIIFSFSSCTKKVAFGLSSVVPAAQGTVSVKTDKNKNNVIQMQITNLADVERLQPARKSYIVWLETDEGLSKNVGRIITTNRLKINFETVSSFKPSRIFITAEDDENTQYPSSMIVLTTGKF